MINVKNMLVSIGYSDKSWKSTKTRLLNKIGVSNAKDTFMVDVNEAIEMMEFIGKSASKAAKEALKMSEKLQKGEVTADLEEEYKEETKQDEVAFLKEENSKLRARIRQLLADKEQAETLANATED